jgi:Holliday junction resolvase RusA-like endonuclease
MIRFRAGYEHRLVVPGQAISFRSPLAQSYKRRVARIARSQFARPLTGSTVEVRIDYFYAGRRRFDPDNVAKCILDGLNRIAYVDDRQVKLQSADAHCVDGTIYLHDVPVDLVKPLERYREYVFIRIYIPA